MIDILIPVALWAAIRVQVLACGVALMAGTSLPVSTNITVTLAGDQAQIQCAEQLIDEAARRGD